MTAPASDVREWLRSQGHTVPARGAIRQDLLEEYERAHDHPTVPGEVIDDGYPEPDMAMGVTEADFPPDEAPAPEPEKPKRERAPRKVTPKTSKAGSGKQRLWERMRPAPGKPKVRKPRQSLSDFAEETWEDLAWIAQPVPPLARMLTLQAPYAGAVFDEQVKGTPVDTLLQPLARYSTTWRALNGLVGPPLITGMICMTGQFDEQTGVPDMRTQMLFGALKYSLLQMTKVRELNAEQVEERTQASVERNRVVDALIESVFSGMMPGPHPVPPRQQAQPQPGSQNGFRYPGEAAMDATGADPGRL